MKKFTLVELVMHKISRLFEPVLAPARRKQLNNTDFTIISNNCWGGRLYEYYGLPKNSPTIGAYIYAEDYARLISNLKYYFSLELEMITSSEAKRARELQEDGHTDCPIGRLGDVEIVFLHYHDSAVAKEKWDRRVKRINWDNLIIKNSYMCRCNDTCVTAFQKLHGVKKFMFVPNEYSGNDEDLIRVPSRIGSATDLGDDVFDLNKYIDTTALINKPLQKWDELWVEE